MQQVVLTPTGGEAIEFSGELLTRLEGQDPDEQTGGRCHDIAIYRLDDNSLAVSVAYRTTATGESSNFAVDTAQDATDVDAILSLYDPSEFVVMDAGHSRTRLVDILIRRYDLQVNDTLSQLQDSADAIGNKPR